jgi:hypothetical protein
MFVSVCITRVNFINQLRPYMYLTISVSSGDLVFFKCVNNEMKNIKSAILCYIAVN